MEEKLELEGWPAGQWWLSCTCVCMCVFSLSSGFDLSIGLMQGTMWQAQVAKTPNRRQKIITCEPDSTEGTSLPSPQVHPTTPPLQSSADAATKTQVKSLSLERRAGKRDLCCAQSLRGVITCSGCSNRIQSKITQHTKKHSVTNSERNRC